MQQVSLIFSGRRRGGAAAASAATIAEDVAGPIAHAVDVDDDGDVDVELVLARDGASELVALDGHVGEGDIGAVELLASNLAIPPLLDGE